MKHALFLMLAVLLGQHLQAQRTYHLHYDHVSGKVWYERELEGKRNGELKTLGRAPILLEEDQLVIHVDNLNPFLFKLQSVDLANLSDDDDDSFSWNETDEGYEVSGFLDDLLFEAENAQNSFQNLSPTVFQRAPTVLSGMTRGGGSARLLPELLTADLGEDESYEVETALEEFTRNYDDLKQFVGDYESNLETSLASLHDTRVLVLDALPNPDLTEEAFQSLLENAQETLALVQAESHISEIQQNISGSLRAYHELSSHFEDMESVTPELTAAKTWVESTRGLLFGASEGNPNNVASQHDNLARLLEEIDDVSFSEVSHFRDLDGLPSDKLIIELDFNEVVLDWDSDNLEGEVASINPQTRVQKWYWETCPGCEPILRAKGSFFGVPEVDPEEALYSDGACGTWNFYSEEGSLLSEFHLDPCIEVAERYESDDDGDDYGWLDEEDESEDVGTSASRTETIKVRTLGKPKAAAGVSILGISTLNPLLDYRVVTDNINYTYRITGLEKSGFTPSLGTAMLLEIEGGRWISPAISMGMAYPLDKGIDIAAFLGPTLRFRNLEMLQLSAGLSFARVQRLGSNYDLETDYDLAELDYLFSGDFDEVLLENKFEMGIYFGLILRQ